MLHIERLKDMQDFNQKYILDFPLFLNILFLLKYSCVGLQVVYLLYFKVLFLKCYLTQEDIVFIKKKKKNSTKQNWIAF